MSRLDEMKKLVGIEEKTTGLTADEAYDRLYEVSVDVDTILNYLRNADDKLEMPAEAAKVVGQVWALESVLKKLAKEIKDIVK